MASLLHTCTYRFAKCRNRKCNLRGVVHPTSCTVYTSGMQDAVLSSSAQHLTVFLPVPHNFTKHMELVITTQFPHGGGGLTPS